MKILYNIIYLFKTKQRQIFGTKLHKNASFSLILIFIFFKKEETNEDIDIE